MMRLCLFIFGLLASEAWANDLAWQEPLKITMPAPTRAVVLHETVDVVDWVKNLGIAQYSRTRAGRRNSLVQFDMSDADWGDGQGICDGPGVVACESAICRAIQVDSEVQGLNGAHPVKARVVKKDAAIPEASDPSTGVGMCTAPAAAMPWEESLDTQALAQDVHIELDFIAQAGARKNKRRATVKNHGQFELSVAETFQGQASFSAQSLPADTTEYDLVVSEGCREVRIPLESVEPAYVPGVVLAAMAAADVAGVAASHQLAIVSQTELKSSAESVVLFAAQDIGQVLSALAADTRVLVAQREYIYTTVASEYSDPLAAFAYGPRESGALYLHKATQGSNQTIAIVDTGVAEDHPELTGRIEAQDFTGEGFTPDQHGTAVAAIIAAAANNQQGAYGVAPAAKLLALKACHPVDGGLRAKCRSSAVVKAIDAAIDRDAQIINMSIAGPPDVMVRRYVTLAIQQNRLVVAGAGNGGPNAKPAYPAAIEEVLAVTAIDADGRLYRDANIGEYVDLAAPGVEILTPTPDGQSYPWTSGTSWAAAHVSGIAALMRDLIPFAGGREVASFLTSQADDLGDAGMDPKFGNGAVNACRAVSAGTAAAVQCSTEADGVPGQVQGDTP